MSFLVHFYWNLGNFQKLKKPCFFLVFRVHVVVKKQLPFWFWEARKSHRLHDFCGRSTQRSCHFCCFAIFLMPKKQLTMCFPILYDSANGFFACCGGVFSQKKSTADYTELPDFADLWMFVDVRTSGNSRVTLYKLEPLKQKSSTHHGSAPLAKTREDETHLALEIHGNPLSTTGWVAMIHEGKRR